MRLCEVGEEVPWGCEMDLEDEVSRYRRALAACVRLQDPDAYRSFVQEWRGLIQRGAAERLIGMDDDSLSVRLASMALDDPGLADVHASARATLRRHGVAGDVGGAVPVGRSRAGTVRLRMPRRGA